jgi:type I restriction enzyme S subunit
MRPARIPICGLADSHKLDLIWISETDKQISELGIENSSAVKHPAGTVILSRDAGIGKSAVLAEEMAVSQHFMAWRCGKRLHNLYFYYWLQHNKPRFEAIAMGSTIKTIGLPYFKLLKIAVPAIVEQRAASEAMLAAEAAISGTENELAKFHHLKSGLMTDLLTGRVRVPELDIARNKS